VIRSVDLHTHTMVRCVVLDCPAPTPALPSGSVDAAAPPSLLRAGSDAMAVAVGAGPCAPSGGAGGGDALGGTWFTGGGAFTGGLFTLGTHGPAGAAAPPTASPDSVGASPIVQPALATLVVGGAVALVVPVAASLTPRLTPGAVVRVLAPW
jgi:hypothetical protein